MKFAQSFFKCIYSCSEEMKIPRSAVLEGQEGAGNGVVLRDVNGKLWEVGVERNGDRWCFKKGWPEFYQDNSLEQLYVLVFEHKSNNLFDFKVFGHNMCEKKGAESANLQVKEEEVDEEAFNAAKEVVDDDDDDIQEESEESSDGGGDDDDEDDDYEEEEEEEEDEEDEAIKLKRNVTEKKGKKTPMCRVREAKTKKCRSTSAGAHNTSCSKGRATIGIGTLPSRRMYHKRNLPDCYGSDIFQAGLAIRPVNRPFFVSRSRTSRPNELFIPKDVIVDYRLEIPEDMFLVDESGKRWKTKVKQWDDGRIWCSGGWRSLCNVNMIKDEDCCICEFVGQGCEDMHILVRRVAAAAATRAPL